MPQTDVFQPENHLVSTIRALKEYAEEGFDNAVKVGGNPSGLEAYEIVMEFPSTDMILQKVPQPKTIIHFELDVNEGYNLGFGENIAREVYDPQLFQVDRQEGRRIMLDFDVGIWATDQSGGTTARLKARQILDNLFLGATASQALEDATNGGDGHLELISFTGGHFIVEVVNGVRIFRMVNCSLELRVYSRTPSTILPSVEEVTQDQTELILDPHLD